MQETVPQTRKPKMMNLFVTGKKVSFLKHLSSLSLSLIKCNALLVVQMTQIHTTHFSGKERDLNATELLCGICLKYYHLNCVTCYTG